jgi:hypothetical protein
MSVKRAPSSRRSVRATVRGRLPVFLSVLLAALLPAGCGYTVLEHPAPAPGVDSLSVAADSLALPDTGLALDLPPGHPPIDQPEDWTGRSFLDFLVGEDEPLRFENMRAQLEARAPGEHAIITLRISLGGPAVMDIWQIRVDEFGWVVGAHWTQGAAEPELDENMAHQRGEFRLDRASESALRAMADILLPKSRERSRTVPPLDLRDVPIEMWPYEDPGLIELDYRIERLDLVDPKDWPGGRIAAPLDVIQVLIGTWDTPPPVPLRRLVRRTVAAYPALIDMALMVEGVVLLWEVEGRGQPDIDLPLRVGR